MSKYENYFYLKKLKSQGIEYISDTRFPTKFSDFSDIDVLIEKEEIKLGLRHPVTFEWLGYPCDFTLECKE